MINIHPRKESPLPPYIYDEIVLGGTPEAIFYAYNNNLPIIIDKIEPIFERIDEYRWLKSNVDKAIFFLGLMRV